MTSLPIYNPPNNNYYGSIDDLRTEFEDEVYSSVIDGKTTRKAVFRRTIDYYASMAEYLQQMQWRTLYSRRPIIQPDVLYQHLLTPPMDYLDNPMNCVCTKHVRTSTNKNKCPIYVVCWTPDGRRLITGASSGEFTLWNGLTFNFETILQAHDTHIRTMKWSHNEEWLLSADDSGMVKYWQANMNDVNVFQAHKDSVRGISFAPSDDKFATCSTDNTVRIFDFRSCQEERVLRGHGGEVRCVGWHPTRSLLISGSKDSQQPIKLWDPKTGQVISTIYAHKSTVTDISINNNCNWFLSASKDHQIKLFDLRNLKSELQIFRGHKKDVIRVAWHPIHETLFASGSGDGALMYWIVSLAEYNEKYEVEVGCVEDGHDNIIWSIDWHPLGHILATGSNDFATKFWTRNRPGDVLREVNNQMEINVSTEEGEECINNGVGNVGPAGDGQGNIIDNIVDLDRLASSIEADLEQSDRIREIPGLQSGLDYVTNETQKHEQEQHHQDQQQHNEDDIDCNIENSGTGGSGAGTTGQTGQSSTGATRTVPRQFVALWNTANSRSLAVQRDQIPLQQQQPQLVPPPILPTNLPQPPPIIMNIPPPPTSLPAGGGGPVLISPSHSSHDITQTNTNTSMSSSIIVPPHFYGSQDHHRPPLPHSQQHHPHHYQHQYNDNDADQDMDERGHVESSYYEENDQGYYDINMMPIKNEEYYDEEGDGNLEGEEAYINDDRYQGPPPPPLLSIQTSEHRSYPRPLLPTSQQQPPQPRYPRPLISRPTFRGRPPMLPVGTHDFNGHPNHPLSQQGPPRRMMGPGFPHHRPRFAQHPGHPGGGLPRPHLQGRHDYFDDDMEMGDDSEYYEGNNEDEYEDRYPPPPQQNRGCPYPRRPVSHNLSRPPRFAPRPQQHLPPNRYQQNRYPSDEAEFEENPFEPQRNTGSSRAFIPLSEGSNERIGVGAGGATSQNLPHYKRGANGRMGRRGRARGRLSGPNYRG